MKLSILDYVPIFEGRNAHDAFNHSITLARTAEQLGYTRYWVAEHHNVFSVASSAPEIVMMMLLEQTQTIKIGSGGVMLPHYSAYKVAEQFRIMEARHPNRVDMGLGRSPSFKQVNEALNEYKSTKPNLDNQIEDLLHYFSNKYEAPHRFMSIKATPEINTSPQMFILGMSERSAELAAQKGLPFVIAFMRQTQTKINSLIEYYRKRYKQLNDISKSNEPYVIMSTFVVTANTLNKVDDLLDALHLWLLRINYLNQPKSYPSINTAQQRNYSTSERNKIEQNKSRVISGLTKDIHLKLTYLLNTYQVDEIMIMPHVYGEQARLELIQLVANNSL